MSEMDDKIVEEFLADSLEGLDRLDADLIELEKDPGSKRILADAFRTLHTIKGTCSFLGYAKLERVAHAGESLMSRLRSGEIALTPDLTSVLLEVVDAVRSILAQIQAHRTEGADEYSAVVARVESVTGGAVASAAAAPKAVRLVRAPKVAPAAPAPPAPPATPAPVGATPAAEAPASEIPADDPAPRAAAPSPATPGESPRVGKLFEHLVREGRLTPDAVARAEERQREGDPRLIGQILVEEGALDPADVLEALNRQAETVRASVEAHHLRVDVELLDRLMNLVGELVLVRNQIAQYVAQLDRAELPAAAQRLNHVTTRLQEEVMRTRMQAISTLWTRIPRLVRDVAHACGKEIRLQMDGNDTELDKTIVEAIKDPLLHLVRNAVDHGIESPEVRVKRGKPPEGRLHLEAHHAGGQVHIEISDDGGGISIERVRQIAIERGLVTREQAAVLPEREWVSFIFRPGFSTASSVTSISGRGVGMDVVKSGIERIGGTIEVISQPGAGTTFKIRIPLTLAIIPALVVEAGGRRFAIPQINVVELLRPRGDAEGGALDVCGAPVYRLRGDLLPLVTLGDVLGRSGEAVPGGGGQIAVVHADGQRVGLVLDRVHDTQEIVVKPLAEPLRRLGVYVGATILGDGSVALILDVPGLARRAGLEARSVAGEADESAAGDGERSLESYLLVRLREDWHAAVPIAGVTRIEEIAGGDVERSRGAWAVKWQGAILPLVQLASHLTGEPARPWERARVYPVLVHARGGHRVGFVLDRVDDIVQTRIEIDPATGAGAILGRAIVRGHLLDLVDLDAAAETVEAGAA